MYALVEGNMGVHAIVMSVIQVNQQQRIRGEIDIGFNYNYKHNLYLLHSIYTCYIIILTI